MLRSELLWSFPAVSWTRRVWISELLSRGENLDLWGMSRGKYSARWCLDLQVETERPVLFVSFCSLNHFFFLGKNRWKIFSAVSCSVSSDRESGPLSCYSETKCQELFITSFSFFSVRSMNSSVFVWCPVGWWSAPQSTPPGMLQMCSFESTRVVFGVVPVTLSGRN